MSLSRRTFRLVATPEEMPQVEHLLKAEGFLFEPDPFFPHARRLLEEPFSLGNSLAAFFGLLYIQDRASMLPPVALEPPLGAAVLDMCASPGSKTGQLASLVGREGLVVGNEPNPARLVTLRRNMGMLNLPQIVTTGHKAESLPLEDASWNYIQLDPPCSGWGTEERNPRVREIWTEDKIQPLVRLQQALLTEANRLLQPGGTLVYSTCTTNPQENEAQVEFACQQLGLRLVPLPTLEGFPTSPCPGIGEGTWNLSPRPGDNQGFFVARLTKDGVAPPLSPLLSPLPYESVNEARLLEQGVNPDLFPGPVGCFSQALHVLPHKALELLPTSLRWQGMYMGKISKHGDVLPSPRLRMGNPETMLMLEGQQGIQQIRQLLQGQSLTWSGLSRGAEVSGVKSLLLAWEGLVLGRLAVKQNRLLWAER